MSTPSDPGPTPATIIAAERTHRPARGRRVLLPATVAALAVVAASTVATAAVVATRHHPGPTAVAGPALAYPVRPVRAAGPTSTPEPSSVPTQRPVSRTPARPSVRPAAGPAAEASPATLFAHPGVPVPAGGELARGSIPWTQVGSGWFIAGWAQAATSDDNHPSVLYLVSPDGRHYQLAYFATGEPAPVFWSPDGTRVLLWSGYDNRTETMAYLELTLATGAVRTVSDGENPAVTYTRPSGTALLFDEPDGGAKIRLDGTRELTYRPSVPGAGRLSYGYATYSPDGALLAVAGATGLAVLTNTGQVRQVATVPNHDRCEPDRWTGNQTLQISCGANEAQDEYSLRIGASPVQLTHVGTDPTTSFLSTMWSTSVGRFGLAAQGCGPSRLVRIDAAGRPALVRVPLPTGLSGTLAPLAHSGDRVLFSVATGQCMPGRRSILSYDVAIGRSVALLSGVGASGTATGGVATWFADR